jgi:DNA-binding IclR family transcriptional regulator
LTRVPAGGSFSRIIGTPSRNTEQQRERVQSVERAIAILRVLAAEGTPLRLADVQHKTGLQKTVAHRLLQTLAAARFVEQDAESGRFHVGIGAFEVAQAYPHGSALIGLSRRHLSELVGGSPHTAYLATLDGFEIVYLAAVEGTGPLRVHVRPGSRNPAYATAVGKVLLAELEDDEIESLADAFGLPQLTPSTITSSAQLLEQVHEVRAQGYALNSEEAYPGIGAIAAVVRDPDGEVRCGISLSYATSLLDPADVPAWVERTSVAARAISAALAGAPVGAAA